MTRSIALFAAAALALTVGAAHAQEVSANVSSANLNLNNAADAKVFYNHLAQTAAAVCGGRPTSLFGAEMDNFERCYRPTLDEAVARAHAPLVTAARDGVMPRVASR